MCWVCVWLCVCVLVCALGVCLVWRVSRRTFSELKEAYLEFFITHNSHARAHTHTHTHTHTSQVREGSSCNRQYYLDVKASDAAGGGGGAIGRGGGGGGSSNLNFQNPNAAICRYLYAGSD